MPAASHFPVLLQRSDYQEENLTAAIARAAPYLGIDQSLAGRKLLLKPNLISVMAQPLACTDGRLLLAVARWFLDHGARVALGDSPAFGSAALVLRRLGIAGGLKKLGVEITEFTKPVPVAGGKLAVARQALECDLLVNLPKVKAHGQMYFTAATKNFFGLVVGMKKSWLHMTHGQNHEEFARLLVQLPALIPNQITIADAIDTMHVTGPIRGKRLAVGCLAAGLDPVAVDTALLAALELAPESCPLQQMALWRGNPAANPENIIYPFEVPGIFHGSGFIAPSALSPIRFHSLRFVVSTAKRWAFSLRRR